MKKIFLVILTSLSVLITGVVSAQTIDSLYTYHIVLVNSTDEDFNDVVSLDLSSKDLIDSNYMNSDLLNFTLRNDQDIAERFAVMPGGSLMFINTIAYASEHDTTVTISNLTNNTLPNPTFHNALTGSEFYFGLASDNQFFTIVFDFNIRIINNLADPVVSYTIKKWQYWNGSSWSDLITNRDADEIISDTGKYIVSFDNPGDWVNTSPPYGSGDTYWVRAVIENTTLPNLFYITRPQYESTEWWVYADIPARTQEFLTMFFPFSRDITDNKNSNQLIFGTATSSNLSSNILDNNWIIYLDVNLDTMNCEAGVNATIIRVRSTSQSKNRVELTCNRIRTTFQSGSVSTFNFGDFFFDSYKRYKIVIFMSGVRPFTGVPLLFISTEDFISDALNGPHNSSNTLQIQFPSICVSNNCAGRPSAVKSLNEFRFYRNYNKIKTYSSSDDEDHIEWTSQEVTLDDVVINADNKIEIESNSDEGNILINLDSISFPTPADLSRSLIKPVFDSDINNFKIEIKTDNTEWIDITDGNELLEFDESIITDNNLNESVQIRITLSRDSDEVSPLLDSFHIVYLDSESYDHIPVTGPFTGDFRIEHIDTEVKLSDFTTTIPKNTDGIFSSISNLFINMEREPQLTDSEEMINVEVVIDRVSFLDNLPLGGVIFLLHKKSGLPIPVVWSFLLMFLTLFIGYWVVKFFGETILFAVITIFMLTTLAMSTSLTDIFAVIMFIVAGIVLLISNREIVRTS